MKKVIRLTESDLHNIIKTSVTRILNEVGDSCDNPYDFWHAADAAEKRGKHELAQKLRDKGSKLYHEDDNDTFIKDTINVGSSLLGNKWASKFWHGKGDEE